MRRRALLLAAFLLAGAVPAWAQQPADRCNLIDSEQAETQDQGGVTVYQIAGPFLVRCQSGSTLRGNQAFIRPALGEIEVIGAVDFRDPLRTLSSDRATYNTGTGRLYATGNVVFTDVARGSTLRGPELEYFRPVAGRPEAQIVATRRPHLTLIPSSGENREPLEVDADQITGTGQDQFAATGNVQIRRSDLDASGAQALYTAVPERLELIGDARIRSDSTVLTGNRVEAMLAQGAVQRVIARDAARLVGPRFTLAGAEIDATLPGSLLERVESRGGAALFDESMRVEGQQIRLFFRGDSLQRVVARGGSGAEQPRVTANGFLMLGDSLDAELPDQQLRRVVAIGNARGEAFDTLPDGSPATTLLPADSGSAAPATDRDWIEGDTLIGFFAQRTDVSPADSVPPSDDVVLLRALATGDARSLYRVQEEADDTLRNSPPPATEPAINYLAGEQIELTFEAGEIDVARVRGLRRGVYLDPTTTTPAPAGSAPPASEDTGR